ncbi:MAG: FtsX-like permease family protein [Acidimicrobiales bacterium]
MAFRAKLRHRWRSWLAIAILVSVVGGLVLAATAAGRRTEAAFPQFVAAHGFDAVAYATQPDPKVAKLPGVISITELVGPDAGQPTCNCTQPIDPTDFGVIVAPPKGRSPVKLVSGRLPDPSAPDQVLASYTFQQDYGVHLGSVIRVPFYALSQASAYNNATGAPPKPKGRTVDFHIVGFEATEFEFPSGTAPSDDLYTTTAFARTILPKTAAGYVYLFRLRNGAADISRFDVAASAVGLGSQNEDGTAVSVETSIHPQAIGWWILAVLAALVGLAVVGQALARQSIVESGDYPTMAALGATRRQLLALSMAQNLVVGLVGAAGAVAVATLLSPIAPLGEARDAENSTGIAFDTPVLLLGALATLAVVLVLGLWPSLRAADALRTDDRPALSHSSAVVTHLAAMGAPPSAVIGVRNALERRTGRGAVPVGSALLGTVLAVMALCGTAVFGASLSHLTVTPRLYGDAFQLNFTDPAGGRPDPVLLRSLEHNKAVNGITEGVATEISVNHVAVGAIAGTAIRGQLLLSTVSGHLPIADDQIGLGGTTMHQVGAHVGSLVHVTVLSASGARRTAPFRVVSQESFPVLGGDVGLGSGAVLTTAGYEDAVCPRSSGRAACIDAALATTNGGGMLVRVVPGARGKAAINHYLDSYRSTTVLANTPTSLINFGEAVNFPLIFGAMLAVVGAATLAHLLVVSVARRRREIGLLKVLGFVNRQVASAVAWQATALALIGIIIGVPLGVVVGRAIWNAFANNLGAVPVSVVPIWLVGVLVAGVLVVANLLAIGPALVATRSKPASLLRAPDLNAV